MLGAHRGGQDEQGEDIVVTAKMAELKQCLLALGGAGGFGGKVAGGCKKK